MKKFTICILATCFFLAVIPTQLKAATEVEKAKTAIKSTEATITNDQLNEMKTIELSALNSSETKEALKDASPIVNEQGRHNGRFNRNHNRDVDVTIRDDGYRHNHSTAYIGGGGLLVLIIILIIIL